MIFEIELTEKEYIDFYKFHYRKTRMKLIRIIIFILVIIAVYQVIFIQKPERIIQNVMIPIFVIGILIYGFSSRVLSKMRKLPIEGVKGVVEFTKDSIRQTSDISETQTRWTHSMKLLNSETSLYLYLNTKVAIIIPKRYLSSKLEEDKIIAFIEERINAA